MLLCFITFKELESDIFILAILLGIQPHLLGWSGIVTYEAITLYEKFDLSGNNCVEQ